MCQNTVVCKRGRNKRPKKRLQPDIPRYIDSQETEDIQDIEAHLLGGIPNADIEALNEC